MDWMWGWFSHLNTRTLGKAKEAQRKEVRWGKEERSSVVQFSTEVFTSISSTEWERQS